MTYGEKAAALKPSMNCAQTVLCALAPLNGLDEQTAKAMGTALGGGLRCGEVCGALNGAIISLGLALGKDGNGKGTAPVGKDAKALCEDFETEFGFKRCAELMRPENHPRCTDYCIWCAEQAAKIIEG